MKLVVPIAVLATVLPSAFSFSYLDSLGPNPVSYSSGGSPSNGASYLDALNSPVSTAPSGTGMKSYLDSVATINSISGPGIGSYTDNMSAAAGSAAVVAEPVVAVVTESSAPVAAAASTGSYLQALSTGSVAIGGPGITSYLDTVPRNAPAVGGAGIGSYTAALPVTNVVHGTGTGLNSYTDNLSGGSKPSKSYSPFGNSKPSPSFSGSARGQPIGFTLEASDLSELVQSMSGGGTIRFSGSIDSVSFN
jgi:hypothetical protein